MADEKPSKNFGKTLLLLKVEMDRLVDEARAISTRATPLEGRPQERSAEAAENQPRLQPQSGSVMDDHILDDRRELRQIWSRLRTVQRKNAGAFEGHFLQGDPASTRKCVHIAYACRLQMHQLAAMRHIARIKL
jgi:hypothetical protein